MTVRKALAVLILLVSALFVSGCTGELSTEEIAEQMQEKEASIQDYSYTMHMTLHLGELTQESELRILQKKPNKVKTISIEPEEDAGSFAVSDGEVMWTYDPKTNTVTKIEMPDTPVLGEMDYAGIIEDFLNETNVSLLGVEEIDGRSAYLLEANPKEEEKGMRLIEGMRLWVDKETWMPLRYETYDINGDPVIELEISDLEVNQGIPDSEFVFEVPEGATVRTVDMDSFEIPEQTTLEKAREAARFEILVPEYLPEGYVFNYSRIFNNSWIAPEGQTFETVSLTYENEEDDVISLSETVYETEAPEAPIMNSAEDVSINGAEGKYLTLGNMKILTWKIGDIELSLACTLDKEELLKIAESIRENA
ncbi:outer membrane lipoprotein-sorting protein [Methanosarcina sp. KYL-1]|uniref:outer membrane lipoprotein-sorting protein n=1 Tax=Methanosarcina sp. KYL-1 TaxID=2602068 RepID=UPI0021012532|nr:outer membrane lipoprotein-sorting protein [Methanosarcina sp. KYL-1]MCQ1534129.1 outer membrane lipoprotein-sorting protein [Methanosarcina sp. KYL-1]